MDYIEKYAARRYGDSIAALQPPSPQTQTAPPAIN